MNTNIEQQARVDVNTVLRNLQANYPADYEVIANHIARLEATIVRALTPTVENAKHVEVLREILDDHETRAFPEEVAAIEAVIRALSAPDNAEADDLDSFIAKQPQHIQEATERRYRELSADNAEAVCPNCDRLTEIRHCQACGCDFANLAPPRIEPITCQTFRHDVGKVEFNPCGECNTEPVKEISLSRVSISDEDLALAEEAASYLHDHASFKKMNATRWAAAICRLVKAVKGEG